MKYTQNQELILQANLNIGKIVEEKWQVPEPKEDSAGVSWKKKLEELSDSKLERQRAIAIHQMRVQQASSMFHRFKNNAEIVSLLTGESYTETLVDSEKKHNFSFLHPDNRLVEPGWKEQIPIIYIKKAKRGLWFLPPFEMIEEWRVTQHLDLDKVSSPMPHDLVCAFNYLKGLQLFNAFRAFESSNGQILISGELWELLPEDGKPAKTSGQEVRFLIGFYQKSGEKNLG